MRKRCLGEEAHLVRPRRRKEQRLPLAARPDNDAAGDGTTTATALAEAIFEEGPPNVTAGANPVALKRGIDAAVKGSIAKLAKMSTPVKGTKDIAQIGSIASNNDPEVGEMIAQAMERARGLQRELQPLHLGFRVDRQAHGAPQLPDL